MTNISLFQSYQARHIILWYLSALLQFSLGFDGHSPITNWIVEAKEGTNASNYEAIYQVNTVYPFKPME